MDIVKNPGLKNCKEINSKRDSCTECNTEFGMKKQGSVQVCDTKKTILSECKSVYLVDN